MNGKKVLVIGAKGMLGSNIIKNFNSDIIGLSSEQLDITNFDEVKAKLKEIKPDIIIHTAAYTNVEECEVQINKAYKINTMGTQNLVNFCVDKDILFVYISSTGNYGTLKTKDRYNEFDKVKPTTIHHKSKYEGEKIVQNHLNKYLIIRTGWLYGGSKEYNKNFVYKRFLEANANDIIYADASQIGNPTYINDLIKQIRVLIEKKIYGIFNCVNAGKNISRYEYVKKIVELFEVPCSVKVAPSGMFKRIAPVSKNESAQNYKLDLLGFNVMGDWQESLSIYIKTIRKDI